MNTKQYCQPMLHIQTSHQLLLALIVYHNTLAMLSRLVMVIVHPWESLGQSWKWTATSRRSSQHCHSLTLRPSTNSSSR